MAEQPKLREGLAEADWWHVAREFRDHDMETEGGWQPHTTMEPVTDAYYIGDWLPVEDVCKEVVRLRAENAKLRAAGEALWSALGNLKTFIANVPSSTAHDAFCNGVHAPDGQCEGMHWLGTAEDDALAADRAWREAAGEVGDDN